MCPIRATTWQEFSVLFTVFTVCSYKNYSFFTSEKLRAAKVSPNNKIEQLAWLWRCNPLCFLCNILHLVVILQKDKCIFILTLRERSCVTRSLWIFFGFGTQHRHDSRYVLVYSAICIAAFYLISEISRTIFNIAMCRRKRSSQVKHIMPIVSNCCQTHA